MTLGLGMGASTAIFSVVDAALLKPLPFRDPERLLVIFEQHPAEHKFKLFVSGVNLAQWRRQAQSLEGVAALQTGVLNLLGGPNGRIDPEELHVERVSANLFPLLGVQAAVGRTFLPEEDQPGRKNFALLSHRLWERRFAADPSIPGKTIVLSNGTFTVVGVLPPDFSVLNSTVDVWLALGLNPGDQRGQARFLTGIARRKPGTSLEQVRSEMQAIGNGLEESNPALNAGWRPSVFPFREELSGSVRQPLLVLMSAVGCLLLMACVNVANLLLTRGSIRQKEIAVRAALGAGRARVAFQLLYESLVLALAAGAWGIVLARLGMLALARLAPATMPRLVDVRLDGRLFLFAFGASLLTGVLFGLAPVLQVSGLSLNAALTEGGRGGTTGRRGRGLRNALVVAEVALAVVVLIGSGLLIRSFFSMRAANAGFQPSGLLTFRVSLSGTRNAAADRRSAFFQQIADRIASLPGVRLVGAVSSLPLTGLWDGATFAVEGQPVPPDQRPQALFRAVTPAYFAAMGIPLIAGRAPGAADTAEAPRVVLINQTLAQRFFAQGSALGSRLEVSGKPAEIVGVVGDVKQDRIEGEEWPTLYTPYPQAPYLTMTMAVRTAGQPAALVSAVQREIHQLDPDQPVTDIRTMESVVDQALAGARFNTAILAVFAVIAFVLASVGIYGVIACDVSERTHEIGIRTALGAQPGDVLKLILGQGARLALFGIVIGLAAAFGLTRLMAAMLYGVKPTDANTFALISVLLAGVALAASYLPSRRAMAMDPVAALRHE